MRFFILSIFISITTYAQLPSTLKLSNKAEISILTCAPGVGELYSYFGHSAIRVKDEIHNIDKVYNYGMFDFSAPNFYLNFCRGKLLYNVVAYDYKYFPYTYYKEKRSIISQTLNLSISENQKVFDFLEWNILPENKNYYYDFFYDNCATKMYEVIEKSIGSINFDFSKFPTDKTHRDLIHLYLPKNSWAKFGIDLALGAVIDKKASYKEYMFLPDYTYLGLKSSSLQAKRLVKKEHYLLKNTKLKHSQITFITSPLFISIVLLVFSLFFLIKNTKISSAYFNITNLIFGVLGIVLLSLWFLTEHSTTKMNLNVLWANPLLVLFPFVKNKLKIYLTYILIASISLFYMIAILGIQEFNNCFYLLSLAISPSFFLRKK